MTCSSLKQGTMMHKRREPSSSISGAAYTLLGPRQVHRIALLGDREPQMFDSARVIQPHLVHAPIDRWVKSDHFAGVIAIREGIGDEVPALRARGFAEAKTIGRLEAKLGVDREPATGQLARPRAE